MCYVSAAWRARSASPMSASGKSGRRLKVCCHPALLALHISAACCQFCNFQTFSLTATQQMQPPDSGPFAARTLQSAMCRGEATAVGAAAGGGAAATRNRAGGRQHCGAAHAHRRRVCARWGAGPQGDAAPALCWARQSHLALWTLASIMCAIVHDALCQQAPGELFTCSS